MRGALTARLGWPAFQLARALAYRELDVWTAYRQGLQFRVRAATWSDDRRREWLLAELRRTVRYAYDTAPFYREHWRSSGFDPRADFSFDDFAHLPPVRREHLQNAADALVSSAVPARRRRRDATGGSTGQPVHIWVGPKESGWRASGVEHFFRRLGAPVGVRTALLWGHHLDPSGTDSWRVRVADAVGHLRRFDCLRLSPSVLAAYHRELQAYQPVCLVAYASALARLAEVIETEGLERPRYPTRCFVTGAEKLYAHQRAVIERVFHKPVFERYGSRDAGNMAYEYDHEAAGRFEVDWAYVHLEPERAEEIAPILITKLHGDAMPLIRYAVDDMAQFPAGAAPGHPVFLLRDVLGRTADRVMLPDGGWLNGLHFPHLLKGFPLRDYQVVQARDYSVTVRLVVAEGFTAEHRHALERNLQANIPGVALSVVLVPAIERTAANKWRPVVSEVQ